MTRDVYAGDESSVGDQEAAIDNRLSRLDIMADDAPEVLHRVAAVLTILNASPQYFVLERVTDGAVVDGRVRIEVHIRGASEFTMELVCRKLQQLTCVVTVTAHRYRLPFTP